MDNGANQPLQLDLHAILRKRIKGWKGRMIPGFLISGLERLICQERLNELLRLAFPLRGSRFSNRILEIQNIKVEVEGLADLPAGGRYVFASNHPLGGLDGIAIVGVLGEHYGDDHLRVLVNDLLMNVEPLADVFLPINKFGAQGRSGARAINEAFADLEMQIVTFPAGLVSRLGDDGVIRDLQWQKAFAAKALAYDRDIVPVRFEALNSMRFYNAARRRKKLGIKVNLEQALLPSELCSAEGKTFRIIFGKPISIAAARASHLSPRELALLTRQASDQLAISNY